MIFGRSDRANGRSLFEERRRLLDRLMASSEVVVNGKLGSRRVIRLWGMTDVVKSDQINGESDLWRRGIARP